MTQSEQHRGFGHYLLAASFSPIAVVLTLFIMGGKRLLYPWSLIFFGGILVSCWAQAATNLYFKGRGYHILTTYRSQLAGLLETSFPYLTVLLAVASIWNVDRFAVHLALTLAYLLVVAALDFVIWRLATVKDGAGADEVARLNEFKEASRQLLWHIDGTAFITVAIWALAVVLTPRGWWESYFLGQGGDRTIMDEHPISEPLLAGVIGCLMIFTVVLLVVHLGEWEAEGGLRGIADASGGGGGEVNSPEGAPPPEPTAG